MYRWRSHTLKGEAHRVSAEAITLHCARPRRQNSSISHRNEVAHRLDQWQGIYRFNLYNECNLLLSVTCFVAGNKPVQGQRGGGRRGAAPDKMNVRGKGWLVSVWREGDDDDDVGEENEGKKTGESRSCDTRVCVCVAAVGLGRQQEEADRRRGGGGTFVCGVERPLMINACHG